MKKISPTEDWLEAVKKHIAMLETDEERREFAYHVIYECALWAGVTAFEMVGILECTKYDLMQAWKENAENEDEDENEDE